MNAENLQNLVPSITTENLKGFDLKPNALFYSQNFVKVPENFGDRVHF